MSKPIKWKLVEVKASELKTNPLNPKKRDEAGFNRLQKSLAKFGKVFDGIANKDLSLIDGHSRLELTDPDSIVSVFVPSRQLSEKEYLEMNAIFDLAKAGETDMQIIEQQFTDEFFSEWGIENPRKTEAVEDDYEIPDEIQTDIVLGDLFEIGPHRLLCGDSTDSDAVARLMDGQKADMVFTDPPYGVSYTGGLKNGASGLEQNGREMIKNDDIDLYEDAVTIASIFCDGPVFMFYADTVPFGLYRGIENVKGEIVALIIWKKEGGYGALGASYKANYEPCVIWKTKGSNLNFIGSTTETKIWEEKKEGINKLHPTQKPVEIPARAISNHKADKVLDLFLGSGSTMVAAHQLNRKCYGMELDPKYCQVIVDRMMKLDPTIEVKKNGTIYKPTV